ncbi:hypothetical protein GCM10011374_04860 [Kocuria dechangensis]|uniref:Uncharacterized protein n=1 Tax=Kocuria dechangensis TaxID=1176249 RepID=A0A917LN00_9MICC|nr:hypothetical protein [Kocuria dechangensis]GGG45607.1 hypothetical protein GCM10011374_04860 [Kocuria dechangensis]
MWSFRIVLAVGLFLFGTTFLWMTAAMAGRVPPPTGRAWTLANVLAYLAVIGFSITAWAVFKQHPWWDTAAVVSAVVGLVAVVPFVVGQRRLEAGLGDLGVQINIWLHVLGGAAVIALAALPAARAWVTDRL